MAHCVNEKVRRCSLAAGPMRVSQDCPLTQQFPPPDAPYRHACDGGRRRARQAYSLDKSSQCSSIEDQCGAWKINTVEYDTASQERASSLRAAVTSYPKLSEETSKEQQYQRSVLLSVEKRRELYVDGRQQIIRDCSVERRE